MAMLRGLGVFPLTASRTSDAPTIENSRGDTEPVVIDPDLENENERVTLKKPEILRFGD